MNRTAGSGCCFFFWFLHSDPGYPKIRGFSMNHSHPLISLALTLVTWFWLIPVEHFVCLTFSLGSVLLLSSRSLFALLVSVWVPSGCSDLPPQSKDFQIMLIGDSEITRWRENFSFFVPYINCDELMICPECTQPLPQCQSKSQWWMMMVEWKT